MASAMPQLAQNQPGFSRWGLLLLVITQILQALFFRLTSYPNAPILSGDMSTQDPTERFELLQGTLDLLVLRTLIFGSQHGQGIARAIEQSWQQELLVEHGALYPSLQRLEERGWISAKWGVSSYNRRARFYSLTAAGRKQLAKETTEWNRLTAAIERILASEEV